MVTERISERDVSIKFFYTQYSKKNKSQRTKKKGTGTNNLPNTTVGKKNMGIQKMV
jgi:hypothetical protein